MANDFYKADELPFINRKLGMVWANDVTEEGDWSCALAHDGAETHTGGVAIDGEPRGGVGKLQNRR
jgi:hypothetical protein